MNDSATIDCNEKETVVADGMQYASGGMPGMVMAGTAQGEPDSNGPKSAALDQTDYMMIQLSSFEGRADQVS